MGMSSMVSVDGLVQFPLLSGVGLTKGTHLTAQLTCDVRPKDSPLQDYIFIGKEIALGW